MSATLQELKAALPMATSDFIVSMLERGATVAEAQTSMLQQLEVERNQARQEVSRLKAEELRRPPVDKPGIKNAPGAGISRPSLDEASNGYDGEDFSSLIQKKIASGMSKGMLSSPWLLATPRRIRSTCCKRTPTIRSPSANCARSSAWPGSF